MDDLTNLNGHGHENQLNEANFDFNGPYINNIINSTKDYFKRGWKPIPVGYKSKACFIKGWPDMLVNEDEIGSLFNSPCNVGVLLESSELTDVDVDSISASQFLGWLPATKAIWGRDGNKSSHFLYKGAQATKQFKNSTGVIIEIRSHGAYAIVPPSIHPSGETYNWENDGEPGEDINLEFSVLKIAIAATLLPYWTKGSRHMLSLSISGVLLKAGWYVDDVVNLVTTIAKAAGDTEILDRRNAVLDTDENLKKGGKISGLDKLSSLIGKQDALFIRSWINSKTYDHINLSKVAKTVDEKRNLAEKIRENLVERGVFYRTSKSGDLLFFNKEEHELYNLGSIEFRALCGEIYKINGKEPAWSYIVEHLQAHCLRHGELTECYRFSRYQNRKLYIHAGGQKVFRLNGYVIDTIDNGDDGVLFEQDSSLTSINPDFQFNGSPVREFLVNVANAVDLDLLDLYEANIYTTFFESVLPTKPIILFTGPKGSGKTSAGRALKRVFYGASANVDTGLVSKEDAFWAAVCNNSYLCIDNVDTLVPWLADALAVVATGGILKRRKLYETNAVAEFVPRCFLMITSRNPQSFTRDDVVDRLLLVEVERRKDFIPEAELLARLDEFRGRIWGELLTNLNQMVLELTKSVDNTPLSYRLADWARLVIRFAPILGIENVQQKLNMMETSKVGFALEDQPIVQALEKWMTLNPNHDFISSGDLYNQICSIYETDMQNFDIKSARQFGSHLKNLRPELESILKIEDKAGPSNKKLFKFRKLNNLINENIKDESIEDFSNQL